MPDLRHYASVAGHVLAGDVPYRDFDYEYPPGSLIPLTLPALFGGSTVALQRYAYVLLLTNMVWGAAIGICVWKMAHRCVPAHRVRTVIGTFVLLMFIGTPIFPWRFDLFPTLLSAITLMLVVQRRPTLAGASLGVAIATKVFPVVLAPIVLGFYMAGGERRALLRFACAAVAGVAVVVAPAAVAAPHDIGEFLRYHSDRGIQIESVSAGLLMLLHTVHLDPVGIVENFGALHIVSSHTLAVKRASLLVAAAALSTVSLLAFLRFRREREVGGRPRDATLVEYSLAAILTLLLTSTVFSPQYLAWLLPLAPLIDFRKAVLVIVGTALTISIFPFSYGELARVEARAVVILNVRNLALLTLLAWLLWDARPSRALAVVRRGLHIPA
jgi:uncharacterized membrane protein